MTLRTPTAMLGVVGALALVACSPRPSSHAETTANPTPAAQARATQPTPPTPRRAAAAPRAAIVRINAKVATTAKNLLNQGTDVNKAATGFGSSQQFLEVAHAAHNLQVPFVVLKDHVLRQRQTLAQAIHQVNPKANAKQQAERADLEARADLAGH